MDKEEKQIKILKIILASLIGVAVILAIALVVVMMNRGAATVSLDSVRKYCESAGMEITEDESTDGDMKVKHLTCQTGTSYTTLYDGETADDYLAITFGEFEKPVMEYSEFAETKNNLASYGTILKEDGGYLKAFMSGNGAVAMVMYLIVDGKTYMQITTSNNDLAKKALIEMGYKDADWPSEQELQETGETAASLQMSQRDTQRRNDIAMLSSALVNYQTNNRGQLPDGPSYWQGEAYLNCVDGNVACKFVQDYLNLTGDGEVNEFESPLGEPYSLYISDNWVTNGGISLSVDGVDVGLVADGDGYTVNDTENLVYVVAGGQCDENRVIQATGVRKFAVMLQLESGSVYCVDN